MKLTEFEKGLREKLMPYEKPRPLICEGSLIESLKIGKEEAYDYLLKKYHKRLYAYALTLINDHHMAQDIVQNVFYHTWCFRDKLNSSYSIKNFLFKSVYNEFLNTYQKNKSTMLLQKKYLEGLSTIVEDINTSKQEDIISLMNKEIQKFPKKNKRIFLLSKKEGLTNIEIAEFLNISIKTVEAQLTKAYKRLRKELNNEWKL